MIMAAIALSFVAPLLLLAFTSTECFTHVSNSLNQIFPKCPPYLPISIICYFRAYSICLVFFRIKCLLVMRKLVSKALTNLMAHFIFLHLINLNHCVLLCCAYACKLYAGSQQNRAVMGNAFNTCRYIPS